VTSRRRLPAVLVAAVVLLLGVARAEDEQPVRPAPPRDLVNQANAPISSVLQVRLLDTYLPDFNGVRGQGNVLTTAVTMPLPEYRLLPFPQLSLLTMPTAVTTPGGSTGFGDVRFVDIAVFRPVPRVVWGIGPTFVFPTATRDDTGQGKWQIGPAAAMAFTTRRWSLGFLAQNPISYAGDADRKETNALFLVPFATYRLGDGWFLRAQPQMAFNWKTGNQVVPIDLGAGRVFTFRRHSINCFVEPFWNLTSDGPTPEYGVTFGLSFLYPDLWHGG
jgi:hypothetical protein